MRTVTAAVLAMTASAAMADDLDDAHRLALSGRDSYWHCLAQEYNSNERMSDQDFTVHIASVCASERQNFRVSLMNYLAMQFPDVDAGELHRQIIHQRHPKILALGRADAGDVDGEILA